MSRRAAERRSRPIPPHCWRISATRRLTPRRNCASPPAWDGSCHSPVDCSAGGCYPRYDCLGDRLLSVKVILATPRGFYAGVIRAIEIGRSPWKCRAPVYVRHEIVHNRHVVERLEAGAARVRGEPGRDPPGALTAICCARGVSRAVANGSARARPSCSTLRLSARHEGAQPRPNEKGPGAGRGADRPCRPSEDRRHDDEPA